MKILLADDHAMVRSGLRLLLERLFEGVVVVEVEDYDQALSVFEDHSDLDLILVDRVMPGADAGLMHELCRRAATTPVVVLSASEESAHVRDAIDCGARGYLPKTTSDAILFSALQLVLSGGTYLPVQLLVNEAVSSTEEKADPTDSILTVRQRHILGFLYMGKTNKEIARDLNISPATVQTHINAIFRALSVSNRTQAVHRAGKLGLITVQPE